MIKACDKALKDKDAALAAHKAEEDKMQQENTTLQKEVQNKNSQLRSPLKQPVIFVSVGVAATIVAGPIGGAIVLGVAAILGAIFK